MVVIDIDSHSRPRFDDYQVEDKYSHMTPRIYFDGSGNRNLVFNGQIVTVVRSGEMELGQQRGLSGRERGGFDGAARYDDVMSAGIDLQYVCADGATRFTYVDPEPGVALCKASNDFLYRAFVKPYPNTFSPLPQLPFQEIPRALQELERCINEHGARTFFMQPNWNGIDMADPYWWNFWDGVRELGVRGVVLHATVTLASFVGKERLGVLGPLGHTPYRIIQQPFEYSTNILNLVFGGMMDVFPELRFAFLEMGAEFATPLRHRIQENIEELPYLREKMAHPLDWYFDRFFFLLDDRLLEDKILLRYTVDELGANHLFFGSDYPHADAHWKNAKKIKDTDSLSADEKEQILGGNAARLFTGA